MTELELYKYINDNSIEWHRYNNNGAIDVMMCVSTYDIMEFNTLVKTAMREDGITCVMKDGYFAFWMQDICDYYGIDMDKVFCGEEQ